MAITVTNKDGQTFTIAGAGRDGKSAYQIAVDNGFAGTEAEWLASLREYPAGGLEGQALVKSTADDTNAVKWGPWPSNPNLLLNWDFRNPVNRNGQSEYTGYNVWSIDLWRLLTVTLTVNDDSITVSAPNDSANSHFACALKNIPRGQTLTLSILVDELNGSCNMTLFTQHTILKQGLNTVTYTVPENHNSSVIYVLNYLKGTIKITAVKLEFGDQQTLAHKDTEGNWVLNDPPNYDLQYLLCSQYNPSTGAFVGSQHSNPNLLTNAYWANKTAIINQRGKDDYSDIQNNQYWIDRFMAYIKPELGTVKLALTDNGIEFQNINIWQRFENLEDGQYTISYLTADGELQTISGTVNNNTHTSIGSNNSKIGLYYNAGYWVAHINASNAVNSTLMHIIGFKVEKGPVQTLAHKEGDTWVLNDPPPSLSLELLKCQRYFQVFETQSARPTKAADFRPTMRTEPAFSTITVNSKTLYTASADL